jgi:hydroperoxide dehydratase
VTDRPREVLSLKRRLPLRKVPGDYGPPVLGAVRDRFEYLKGKCALGPFLSILVIECQHKCLNVNLCPWMNKVQIKSKGMFLSLSTLVLCTNIFV